MNYQRTKPTSKRATKIVLAVVVVLIVLRLAVPHAFAAFFTDVFSPLWKLEHFVLDFAVPEHQIIFSSDSQFASSTVAELEQENMYLKSMLGRPILSNAKNNQSTQDTVVATVLSKPPFSAYDTLIVDAGSVQGVQAGDNVFALADPVVYSTTPDMPPSASTSTSASTTNAVGSTTRKAPTVSVAHTVSAASTASTTESASTTSAVPGDPRVEIPIGQVVSTFGNTSVVRLFSSPGQTYPVEIGSYHIAATANAEGSGMFEAMVPNNSNVTVGDPVIVPGIQSGVFASVVSVVSDPARPYSLVVFQSPVDPFSLYFVGIVTTK